MRHLTFLILAMGLFFAVPPAHADTLQYVVQVPGDFSLTFDLPQNPTPDFANASGFAFTNTNVTLSSGLVVGPANPVGEPVQIGFGTGSLRILSNPIPVLQELAVLGPQLWTGTPQAPTLLTGTFTSNQEWLARLGIPSPFPIATVTDIGPVNTPECATLTLTLIGVLFALSLGSKFTV